MEIKITNDMYQGYTAAEKQVLALMDRQLYAEALNYMPDVLRQEEMKPEFFYRTAYCYFMQGDYERASKWIDDALGAMPGDIQTLLLLAKICTLCNRSEDGLAVLDMLVKNAKEQLSGTQQEEVKDCSLAFLRKDKEAARKNYPSLAEFVLSTEDGADGKSAKAILTALKQKLAEAKERDGGVPAENSAPVAKKEVCIEKETCPSEEKNSCIAQAKAEQVLSMELPVKDKIRLLNQFAGAFYFQGDAKSAKVLLTASLKLDIEDGTLRNMALVMAELGDREKAMQFAAQMKETDFMLLKSLR